MEVHIGGTLKLLLKKKGLSHPQFAELMGISLRTAQRILASRYLHTTTMLKISEVLEHDLCRYLYLPENLPGNKALQQQVEQLQQEVAALKEKVTLQEKLIKEMEKKG